MLFAAGGIGPDGMLGWSRAAGKKKTDDRYCGKQTHKKI
jgi:hypothetical protein